MWQSQVEKSNIIPLHNSTAFEALLRRAGQIRDSLFSHWFMWSRASQPYCNPNHRILLMPIGLLSEIGGNKEEEEEEANNNPYNMH